MNRPYGFQDNNVALIFGLKNYCAIGFLKGSLLKDVDGILVKPGEHSRAMRQLRFTSIAEIVDMEDTIKAYVQRAIEVEKTGLQVKFEEKKTADVPDELKARLDADPALKTAFEGLTPGRQRGYVIYFSGAKQSATRISRIEKCIPKIMNGKGLNDR